MNTAYRIAALVAAAVLTVASPAGAATEDPPPPAADQWPPASTHGVFHPVPEPLKAPVTFTACNSEITLTTGDVDTTQYRALVTEDGDTVVEYRGQTTVDVTRASDGAMLDELDVSGPGVETYSSDGRSATFDWAGPSIVVAFDELEAEAFAQEGLPQAFLYLSGRFTETVTFASEPQTGQEVPPVSSAEITENSTDYVFDLCDLLDQAAAGQAPAVPEEPAPEADDPEPAEPASSHDDDLPGAELPEDTSADENGTPPAAACPEGVRCAAGYPWMYDVDSDGVLDPGVRDFFQPYGAVAAGEEVYDANFVKIGDFFVWLFDTDEDGVWNQIAADLSNDGNLDVWYIDHDPEDGAVEELQIDWSQFPDPPTGTTMGCTPSTGEVCLIPVPGGGTTIVFPGVAPYTPADAVKDLVSTDPCAPYAWIAPDGWVCRF
jgi:hypothetical protein